MNNRTKALTQFGECVFNTRGHFSVCAPGKQTALLHIPQISRQNLLGDVSNRAFQFAEPFGSIKVEFINDDELVELTPTDIRIRKKYLTALERRQHMRELNKAAAELEEE